MEIINFLERYGVLVTTDRCGDIAIEFELCCPKCGAYNYSGEIDERGTSSFYCCRCRHTFESTLAITTHEREVF